jgi:hypothetical protein
MKKIVSILVLQTIAILAMGQTVSDYIYKFDNGIAVKSERGWDQVWVQQSYAALAANDQTSYLRFGI